MTNLGYQIGYKGIDVEVISMEKNVAHIMWNMLKQTWVSLHDIPYDPENPKVQEFIKNSVARRLNPVPMESAMIEVIFKNISRVNLAQLTRHRGWTFNSESQMPQHVDHNVMIPLNIADNKEWLERAKKLIKDSQELYDEMTAGNDLGPDSTGIPYQDARYLLVHSQTSAISAMFNLPSLVNASPMQLENNTHDEINYTFRILIKRLLEYVESCDEMDELTKYVYRTMLGGCDVRGARQGVGTCTDDMIGNSMKRYPDADSFVTKVTDNRLFDYKKLAWYKELIRMTEEEPELLLPNEKEMIDRWLNGED